MRLAAPAIALWIFTITPLHAVGIGPISIPLKVAGVSVQLPVVADLDIVADPSSIRFTLAADGDLADVQAKALDIARALPLPKEECAHDGLNVVVGCIDAASISPAGDAAAVALSATATVWTCGKLAGVRLKTILLSDTVQLSIPVRLIVIGPQEVGLKLAGPASITTGSKLTATAAHVLVEISTSS